MSHGFSWFVHSEFSTTQKYELKRIRHRFNECIFVNMLPTVNTQYNVLQPLPPVNRVNWNCYMNCTRILILHIL